ncbi:hypothetical protein, partial [Vibrio coralliirubri]|uniref:hypothetical protein n=1 Tax=Vibrio coralliirubri TaxID=1516159 RepID=UPI000AD8A775
IIFRPHVGPWFKLPLPRVITKKKAAISYSYMVDNTDTYFFAFLKAWTISGFVFNIKELLSLFLWCVYYKKCIFRIRVKADSKDTMFFFLHGNLSTANREPSEFIVKFLEDLKCKKICHLS